MIEFIKTVSSESTLGVWRITETPLELALKMESEEERLFAADYHPKKQREYYASRLLVSELVKSLGLTYHGVIKDEHGKPFLKNHDIHLSITHNDDFVGCLVHRTHSCGLDIEHPREQLLKISRKFLHPEEQEMFGDDLELLTQAWSAKETIYKIYGRKKLHFSTDIRILRILNNEIEACVTSGDIHEEYKLRVEHLDSSCLVYNL